ncbi:DUF6441 family protein, partial [Puniceibacterium confluentis]
MKATRIEAALVGNLEAYMAEELDLVKRAVTAGVRTSGTRLKNALRRDVVAGGLGSKLSKSWRQANFPKQGASLGAATTVETKAPKLIRAFNEGATIRSSEGFFLALPTEDAPKKGVGGKRLTPENFPEHRFGPLRFVYRQGRASMLVVDNQRQRKGKRGGYALSRNKRALATSRDLMTVPMFILVPRVRLRRRLNVDAVSAAA